MNKTDFCYIETASLLKNNVPECQTEYAFGDNISSLERHNVKNNNKIYTYLKAINSLFILSLSPLLFSIF